MWLVPSRLHHKQAVPQLVVVQSRIIHHAVTGSRATGEKTFFRDAARSALKFEWFLKVAVVQAYLILERVHCPPNKHKAAVLKAFWKGCDWWFYWNFRIAKKGALVSPNESELRNQKLRKFETGVRNYKKMPRFTVSAETIWIACMHGIYLICIIKQHKATHSNTLWLESIERPVDLRKCPPRPSLEANTRN